MRIGADTGGTFTDVVADDGSIAKVPSTPDDPGGAVRSAVAVLGRDASLLAHGTTVATNALLERKGATVALVTTQGLADVIEIGRQDRPSLYDGDRRRPEPLVSRARRVEIGGRLDATGAELEPVDVPPMSKVTASGNPQATATAAAACTPPAALLLSGPAGTSAPRLIGTSPPADVMTSTSPAASCSPRR